MNDWKTAKVIKDPKTQRRIEIMNDVNNEIMQLYYEMRALSQYRNLGEEEMEIVVIKEYNRRNG